MQQAKKERQNTYGCRKLAGGLWKERFGLVLRLRLLDTCLVRSLMLFVGTGIFLGGLGGLMMLVDAAGQASYYVTIILYGTIDPEARRIT